MYKILYFARPTKNDIAELYAFYNCPKHYTGKSGRNLCFFGILFEKKWNKLFIEIAPVVGQVARKVGIFNKSTRYKIAFLCLFGKRAFPTEHDAIVVFHKFILTFYSIGHVFLPMAA